MPRVAPLERFIEYRLRHIAANKQASPSTQLRAIFALSVMAARRAANLHWAFDVQMRDQDPRSGDTPENLSGNQLDDTVKAMLERASKHRGGANAKLPESGTSGS